MEQNVFESRNRAVLYLDLLGFAALVEANPEYSGSELLDICSVVTPANNPAAQRLSMFHQVLDSNISSGKPNHAMVFSDCAFAVFYTLTACAEFAVSLMQGFLQVKVPVRMGLGFGTFRSVGTTSSFSNNSTVIRSMFGGTSIVRAVAAEGCGAKGMRILAHTSFSNVFDVNRMAKEIPKLIRMPNDLKSVSNELDYVSGTNPETIDEWIAGVRQMARSSSPEAQIHYAETFAALSRMLGYNIGNADGLDG